MEYHGNYRAKVLDNADPAQTARVKVEVYPMLLGEDTARELKKQTGGDVTGITTARLPWAKPATPLLGQGAGDSWGVTSVPRVGSFVWVFFEMGDIHQPVYFAGAPTAGKGQPPNRITSYPDRMVISFSSGTEIVVDNNTGDIIITGNGDVVVQGSNVRLNPLSSWE
jgi:hypothetical protein